MLLATLILIFTLVELILNLPSLGIGTPGQPEAGYMMDSPGKLQMEEQKKLEEELLDNNSEMS